MNKVFLVGRLAKDPELKLVPGSGKAVTNFTIAVDRRFKREGQPEADFINVVVWGKQAEATANHMNKGKQIAVSGRIEIRSYEAKDGTKRYVTEVIADEVQFLEWGNKTEQINDFSNDVTPIQDDDIPF